MTSVERKDQPQSRQLKRCTRDSAVWIHTVALNLLYQPIHPWLNIPCVFFSFSVVCWSQLRGPKNQGSQHPTSTKRFVSRQRKLQEALLVSPFRCLIQVIPTSKFGSTSQGETLDIRMFDVTFFVYEHSRAIYWGSLGECNILNAVLFSALNFGREWVMIHTHIQEVVELWIVDFNNLTTLQALKGTVCQLNWSGLHFALPSQLVFRNHSSNIQFVKCTKRFLQVNRFLSYNMQQIRGRDICNETCLGITMQSAALPLYGRRPRESALMRRRWSYGILRGADGKNGKRSSCPSLYGCMGNAPRVSDKHGQTVFECQGASVHAGLLAEWLLRSQPCLECQRGSPTRDVGIPCWDSWTPDL